MCVSNTCSVHIVGRIVNKFIKETESREGIKGTVMCVLLTDGLTVISAQAWGFLASHIKIDVRRINAISIQPLLSYYLLDCLISR
jgi:hypothetical protein